MKHNLEYLSVNYNTPDLIERLIESIIKHEGKYPIRIIDGSDKEPYKTQIVEVCAKYDNVTLQQLGWNIHHGRGMNWGVFNSKYDWVYIFDSDNYVLQPHLDKMMESVQINNKLMCGVHCHVNTSGWGEGREASRAYPIMYYHPSQFLISTSYYKQLKENGVGFIHHGAPSIQIMQYLHDNNLSHVYGITLKDAIGFSNEDYGQWTCLDSRGTRLRFGSNW